jgi:hypothetical protein
MMGALRRLSFCFVALLALLVAPAYADDSERITSFTSDVTVAKNGVLTVTETIAVVSAGEQIRHGIYRDFPITYENARTGLKTHVSFAVISVTRDGHDEPYDISSIDAGQRVKMGDADTELDDGPHVYTLTYTTDRQIGFYDGYDELYWNATGNFWAFTIDRARAVIHLPHGAVITQHAFYTGAAGSTDKNARVENISGNAITFVTTQALLPNEGMTIAVGFTKGAVLPPTAAEQRATFLRDNAAAIAAAMGLLILVVYFAVTWFSFGRDPEGGPVIPLFAAPRDFSPAAVRFVCRMGYDRKSFSASLINMAVKRFLTISESGGDYTLTRTGKSVGEAGLSHGEAAIANKLFADGKSMELKQANHSDISEAISALKTSLKNEYERAYFVTNLHWFIGGFAILGITALTATLLSDDAPAAGFILVWLTGWSAGTTLLLHRAWDSWVSVFAGPGSRFLNLIGALVMSAFALPFTTALIVVLFIYAGTVSWPVSLQLTIGGALAYIFYHLLKAPTLAGAKVLAEIKGLRLYLDTAEKDRLEMLNPPQVTPEVFEKFLPYAIALDCENRWSKKFEAEAAAAGIDPNTSSIYYSPTWYSGSSHNFSSAAFASSLGASMAAAAASAATAPGSSSGSGGGGSSGGGGGGGGGGGW